MLLLNFWVGRLIPPLMLSSPRSSRCTARNRGQNSRRSCNIVHQTQAMDPDRWIRLEHLYHSALEREPWKRRAFLVEVCEGDEDLCRVLDQLLSQSDLSNGLVGEPIWEAVAGFTEPTNTVSIGTRLGPYEILGTLGAGGMGKVYRALDTRLDRTVAIKISDEQFTVRFEREARAISALNHANICTLYDIGANYLVMELVEGETLAQRIERAGPIPLEEALEIALQISHAVEQAHGKGIVHRDLKPANVKITPAGQVKVLDFGLAKSVREQPITGNAPKSGSATASGSVAGQVLGTPAYMSPEQARGEDVDTRTDIWAFGCVLYELLTGTHAIPAERNSDTITAILEREPDWLTLPAGTPKSIRNLLRTCLDKDANRRPLGMREVRACVEDAARGQALWRWSIRKFIAVAGVVLAIAGLTAWFLRERADSQADEVLRPIPLTSYPGTQIAPSFSPDGTMLAFTWDGEKQDNFDIYVKSIGPGPPLRLTRDPLPDVSPEWSPDGNSIAFLRDVRSKITFDIMLMSVQGGSERRLGQVAWARNSAPGQTLSWSPDGKWLASYDRPQGEAGGLWLISVETGERRRLTTMPDTAVADDGPAFSPDGSLLAFIRRVGNNESDLYLLPLGKDLKPHAGPRRLTQQNSGNVRPAWTPDGRELIYGSGPGGQDELWRVSIADGAHPRRLTTQNEVMAVAVSRRSNRLIYAQSRREMDIYRVELGAKGGEAHGAEPLIASSRHERYPRYSPDGKKISFISLRSGNWQLWTCDSDGGNLAQLTSFDRGEISRPEWTADGREIEFKSNAEGTSSYYAINAAGGKPRKLDASSISTRTRIASFAQGGGSLDGRYLYFGLDGSMWRVPAQGPTDSPYKVFSFDGILPEAGLGVDRWGIYFVANISSSLRPGEMMFYHFPNGPVSKVKGVDAPSYYGSTVSPDGRYLLYTKFTATGSDLMLVENFR